MQGICLSGNGFNGHADNTAFFARAAGSVTTLRPPITASNAVAEFDAAAGALIAGYAAPGVLDGDIATSFGVFPGAVV